jgi:hypothetical protein
LKSQEKIRNQVNEDQIRKYNTINLDWMIKLTTNETFTKVPSKKIKNQENKDQLENNNICQIVIDGQSSKPRSNFYKKTKKKY